MTGQRILLVAINLFSTFLALYVSISAIGKRKESGMAAIFLALSMAGTAVYAFFYATELANDNLNAIYTAVKIEHIGIQAIAPFWLLFTLSVTGRQKWITKTQITVLFIIPVLLVISAFSGWMHANPRLTPDAPFPTFLYDKTAWSWLSVSYISLCLVISFFLFMIMLIRSPRTFRKQALVLLIGSVFPWMGMLITQMGLSPYNLDLTPFTISISGIIYFFGFNKYQILDIVPMARDIIFESMGEGVLVLDNSNRIVDMNPMLRKIFPESLENAIGLNVETVFHAYPTLLTLINENSNKPIEIKMKNHNPILYYRCILLPLVNPQKKTVGKIVTFHDFSETENLIQQLQTLATLDTLTGVYNRRHFYDLAIKEVSRAKRFKKDLSLILFDLDNFKEINDTLGHSAGDVVLKNVVNTLVGNLREYDIIGRFGGDEFLILLINTDLPTAFNLAAKLRTILEKIGMTYEGHSLTITASFGVASANMQQQAPFEDLVRQVDRAMYEAKEQGRNRVCILNDQENCQSQIFQPEID